MYVRMYGQRQYEYANEQYSKYSTYGSSIRDTHSAWPHTQTTTALDSNPQLSTMVLPVHHVPVLDLSHCTHPTSHIQTVPHTHTHTHTLHTPTLICHIALPQQQSQQHQPTTQHLTPLETLTSAPSIHPSIPHALTDTYSDQQHCL